MKAVFVTRHGGPEVLQLLEGESPIPGEGEVLIAVEATGVNFADVMARRDNYRGAEPPFIPGLDVFGRVAAIGPKVQKLKVGQRVVAFPHTGSYAEATLAKEVLTFPVPDSIPGDVAAACPVISFTAYNLLHLVARVQPGERVLIHASAGGVGTTAVQLAKLAGASQVIGTVGSDAKVNPVQELGADLVVNYQKEDYVQRIREATGQKGVDVILNSVAGETVVKDMEVLAPFGRLVVFGHASGQPGSFLSNQLHATSRSVLGYSFGALRKLRPEQVEATAQAVLSLLEKEKLRMMIGRRLPLAAAAAAHEWVESRQSVGKTLLAVAGTTG